MTELTGMTLDMAPMPVNMAEWTYYAVFGSLLSIAVVVLLGIVIFFLRRMVAGQDSLKAEVITAVKEIAVGGQKLEDHIANEGMHCKGPSCLNIRSVTDGHGRQTG